MELMFPSSLILCVVGNYVRFYETQIKYESRDFVLKYS